jgi:hypothetical protein
MAGECRLDRTGGIAGDSLSFIQGIGHSNRFLAQCPGMGLGDTVFKMASGITSQYGRYLKSRRGARDGHAVALETDGYTILSPDEVDAGDLADRMNPAIV